MDQTENSFQFSFTDASGVTYTPWTNGYAVGFHCTDTKGEHLYLYLNPSSGDEGTDVFLYSGAAGNPELDTAWSSAPAI